MQVGQVIAGLVKKGVREFVVCPGAHDAVIVEVLVILEERGAVKLWSHFEERGAGFFALGRAMTGKPCAVVTTSGTAAAELLPAVIEAHYQARPLVVVTADRPERFRGSGAPQAIEQAGLFGGYVEGGDDVVVGSSKFQAPSSNAEERGLMEGWSGRGAWQVNVCLEEDAEVGEVPEVEVGRYGPVSRRLELGELAGFLREGIHRGLVVMVGDLKPEDREEAFHFCHGLGAPVVAEATSGLREALVTLQVPNADRALAANPPGKVLRLGGVPSGRFWRDLERLPEVEVCSVTQRGFSGLARESLVVAGEVGRVIRGLGDVDPWGDVLDHLRNAEAVRARIEELLEEYPDSEPALVRTLSAFASLGSSVFLGNSLPIREWNRCAQWQRPVPDVRANRGANGIDGQVSSWLGWSAEWQDAWAVLGDLTALYDLAAPAMLGQVENKGRVLAVINNSGGRIFERLPRLEGMSGRTRKLLRAPQEARLGHWAEMWGMDHLRVDTGEGFDALEGRDAARSLLLELVPDERQTAALWSKLG
jgi:2-succinyl-5-enolpyruvyl-6-hydroxy-3-cyclohexene-1-carboxylate synthase